MTTAAESPTDTDSERAPSSTERVIEEVRRLIYSGAVLPGQELRQAALAKRFGTSRVPIREALQLLVAEGLVQHTNGFGYHVVRLTADELHQLYHLRGLLETEVLKAVNDPDGEGYRHLAEIVEAQRAQVSSPDVTEFQRLNREFHLSMMRLSGMDFIVNEIDRLWGMSEPYRIMWAQVGGNRGRSVAEHEIMLDALKAHDIPLLVDLCNKHREHNPAEVNVLLR